MNSKKKAFKKQIEQGAFRNALPRDITPKASQVDFDAWLAGFIDADGYFGLSKAGQSTLEITTDVNDLRLLRSLQKKFGGSVKPRAGSASVRWRLTHRDGMRQLCDHVNGHIRFKTRWAQFERTCAHLGLTCLQPVDLKPDSAYAAGLFAGDGCVTLSVGKSSAEHSVLTGRYGKQQRLIHSRGHNQISLHVDSSDKALLVTCARVMKLGSVITKNPSSEARHRRAKTHYRWLWRSFDEVSAWRAYVARLDKTVPKSFKHRRLVLSARYFDLKLNKNHLAQVESSAFKSWVKFCLVWFGKV